MNDNDQKVSCEYICSIEVIGNSHLKLLSLVLEEFHIFALQMHLFQRFHRMLGVSTVSECFHNIHFRLCDNL